VAVSKHGIGLSVKKVKTTAGHFAEQKQRIKLHVSELRIGMYVSELDRPWLETPFLIQGFTLETIDDVTTMAEYCEHVWVDAVQEAWVPPEERKVGSSKQSSKLRYINKVSASDEHRQSLGVHREARRLTKNLMDEARLGASINTEQAKSTVKNCVNSILRNPDAMLWMTKMRDKDEYTSEHCLNVCVLAIAFGRHLGFEEEALQNLGLCGLLHDVGKMRVPLEVVNKPSRLTDEEFKAMKAHAIHGRNLLMSSPGVPHSAVDVAYSHHERLDGGGYPRGLKASGISDNARMIAIVDAYDAMTAERCYAEAIPSTEALKEILNCSGEQFDVRLAEQFIEMVGVYPPGSIVELVNGCVAIVLNNNYRYRHLPRILVVRNPSKRTVKEKVFNLNDVERGDLSPGWLIQRVLIDGTHDVKLKHYQERGLQISFD